MNVISKADIVNSRITAIHVVGKEIDDCTYTTTYFSIDRGFSFCLPSPGAVWKKENVPADAVELLPSRKIHSNETFMSRWLGRLCPEDTSADDVIQRIFQRTIIHVLCRGRDVENLYPDDVFLIFDDGSQLNCLTVAPRGISTGFRYYPAGEVPFKLEESIDFFDVPPL